MELPVWSWQLCVVVPPRSRLVYVIHSKAFEMYVIFPNEVTDMLGALGVASFCAGYLIENAQNSGLRFHPRVFPGH
jgi:hypothetical protein